MSYFAPSINNNKIHFISLGCPRNLVDSEVMLGLLLKAGYEVIEAVEEADFLIVNTCGFLESSRKESLETIEALFQEKKESAKVIVAGCMVSKHKEELSVFDKIHYLLGSGDVEGILKAVQEETPGEKIGTAKSYLESGEVPRKLSTPSHFAYLKIAEGCRKACAYCIIPKIKGPLKSKSIEQVKKEAALLLKQGVKEIILIAQDLGDYGKDFPQRSGMLCELLKGILEIEGEYWLRLLYLYPDEITDELIEVMQSDKRILPYLDMPIQHINDSMLKSMRRKTNAQEIKTTIEKLKAAIPDIHIRTSLIVGFPGETEKEFKELEAFIQKYPLNHVGIFKYSKEKNTVSYDLENHVAEEVKQERLERLARAQLKSVKKLNKKMIGRCLEVVIEGHHPESDLLLVGRYFGQCPEIDGQVILNDWGVVEEIGERYLVEITDSADYDLVGRVLAPVPKLKKRRSLAVV